MTLTSSWYCDSSNQVSCSRSSGDIFDLVSGSAADLYGETCTKSAPMPNRASPSARNIPEDAKPSEPIIPVGMSRIWSQAHAR